MSDNGYSDIEAHKLRQAQYESAKAQAKAHHIRDRDYTSWPPWTYSSKLTFQSMSTLVNPAVGPRLVDNIWTGWLYQAIWAGPLLDLRPDLRNEAASPATQQNGIPIWNREARLHVQVRPQFGTASVLSPVSNNNPQPCFHNLYVFLSEQCHPFKADFTPSPTSPTDPNLNSSLFWPTTVYKPLHPAINTVGPFLFPLWKVAPFATGWPFFEISLGPPDMVGAVGRQSGVRYWRPILYFRKLADVDILSTYGPPSNILPYAPPDLELEASVQ